MHLLYIIEWIKKRESDRLDGTLDGSKFGSIKSVKTILETAHKNLGGLLLNLWARLFDKRYPKPKVDMNVFWSIDQNICL